MQQAPETNSLFKPSAAGLCLTLSIFGMVAARVTFKMFEPLRFLNIIGTDMRVAIFSAGCLVLGLALTLVLYKREGSAIARITGARTVPFAYEWVIYSAVMTIALSTSWAANAYFDQHAPEKISVSLEAIGQQSSSYSRQEKIIMAYTVPEKFTAGKVEKSTLVINQTEFRLGGGKITADVIVKPGLFGIPWIQSHSVNYVSTTTQTVTTTPGGGYHVTSPSTTRTHYLNHRAIEISQWMVPSDEISSRTEPVATETWANGKIKQSEPRLDNKNEGLATYWFDNGQLYGHIPWWQGEKHGRFNLYRPDGTLEQSLSYRHGKPHGLLCWYDERGTLKIAAVYEDGSVIDQSLAYSGCPAK